jgi:hypothetical protein
MIVSHGRDAIRGKAYTPRMFLDGGLVRGEINAIHFVTGHIAMQPLDLRSHTPQHFDRLLGNFPQLGVRQIAGTGDFAFDYKLGHGCLSRTHIS